MERVIYSKKDLNKCLEEMKSFLNSLTKEKRTIIHWNYHRERFKKEYPEQAISWLDASGFIVEWLEGK